MDSWDRKGFFWRIKMDVDIKTALGEDMSRSPSMIRSLTKSVTIPEITRSRDSTKELLRTSQQDEATPSKERTRNSTEEFRKKSSMDINRNSASVSSQNTVKEHTQSSIKDRLKDTPGEASDIDAVLNVLSENTEELLMSDKEIEERNERMAEMAERLSKQQADYEQWENSINRRRLIAYGRMKNLSRNHNKRLVLYSAVEDYVKNTNILLYGKTDEEKSMIKE